MCMDKSTIGKGGAKFLALGNAVVVRGLIVRGYTVEVVPTP